MTIGDYLKSLVFGLDLTDAVIDRAVHSPMEVNLAALSVADEAYPASPSADFQKRLDYASSTVYYAVLGVFSGGGYAEQVGDVRVSKNGLTVTTADRERFKMLADNLRKKWGFTVEDEPQGGISDFTYLRRRR